MSVYIIAEAGINHNGSMAVARMLANAAKEAGANAVKYQTYVTDDICRKDSPEYAWLKKCELSYDQFRELKKHCDSIGIDFISTPDTVKDAEFLDTLGMRYMKIGSANATKEFTLSIGHIRTPLIVSLGMSSRWVEISYAPNVGMHCVSAYPCPVEQANMKCIEGLKVAGFSDHTTGSLCAIMAIARGAKFIEKHFTLDRKAEGPDHHMSMDPDELQGYIHNIRQAELALGDGVRRVMPCEQKTIEQLKARK
jgi:N-acetylneuraminate synthase/N,N'-diacetyllegionaminate synthase